MIPRPKVPGARMPGRLFNPPAADEAKLTDRQAFALAELRANPKGLTSETLGRAVHDHFQPAHSAACPYCSQTGSYVLKALKTYGLVRLRAGGVWQAVTGTATAPDLDDPQNQPWPEGF